MVVVGVHQRRGSPLEEVIVSATTLSSKVGAPYLQERAKGRPWFNIAKTGACFQRFLSFKVSQGSRIRFWKETWIGDASLASTFPDIYGI